MYKKGVLLSILCIFILAGSGGVFNAHAFTIDDLKTKIEKKEQEIAELREQAAQYEGEAEQKREYAGSLESQISQHNNELYQLGSQIDIKEREIETTEFAIEKVFLEINEKKEGIALGKTHMRAIIQEIYKNDGETVLELVLKYDDFSNFYNQVQAREALQEAVGGELEELKKLKNELDAKRNELEREEEELGKDQQILTDKKKIEEWERSRQRGLLAQTREQEARYQKLLLNIEDRDREVREEIFRLEDQLRITLDPSSLPTPRPGLLEWPTEGLLTQGYGCLTSRWARRSYPLCNNDTGGFHNGVDIAAAFSTRIIAAEGGVVIAVENSPYAYGLWVAVEHSNGLTTAYTHMSLQSVKVGQTLSRGELVGYMGSTGFSTGSHTHFMVYASNTFTTKASKIAGILPIGATINPFNYLN